MSHTNVPNGTEADQLSQSPDEVGEMRTSYWQRLMGVVNKPFELASKSMMSTLRGSQLSSQEGAIIDESEADKYIPVPRNAIAQALIATPGLLMANNLDEANNYFMIVGAVSGIAWFTISLREVKERLLTFGIEMTSDVLEAFLITAFTVTLKTGCGIASPQIMHILGWMQEAGMDINEVINSPFVRHSAPVATVLVLFNATRLLFQGVIKFDAVDALQTGAGPLARRFFKESLSELRNTANHLMSEHTVESANSAIVRSLTSYYRYLKEIDVEVDENALDEVRQLASMISGQQEEVDKIVIPRLRSLLDRYGSLIEGNEPVAIQHQVASTALEKLQAEYDGDTEVNQSLADSTISMVIATIAELLEYYEDQIGDVEIESTEVVEAAQ